MNNKFLMVLILLFSTVCLWGQPTPTAWYALDGDVTDSQNSNHGTNNGVSFVAGLFDQAADGQEDASIDLPTGIIGADHGSFSLWINYDVPAVNDDGHIFYGAEISGGNGNSDGELHLTALGDGSLLLFIGGGSGSDVNISTSVSYDDGQWHHVVGTWDASSVNLYVDNSLVASVSNTADAFQFSEVFRLTSPGQQWREYPGLIDQVRIYDDVVLSSADVDALFNDSGSGGGGTTQYTLTTNTSGSGTVTLDPSGGTYDEGTEVTVTANADAGWEFDSWAGDLSGSTNPETILMDADKSVTANFTESTGGTSSIILQENESGFCSVDGPIESEHSGYTGSGYANTDNASGNTVEWSVDAPSAGTYTLEWRFANGGSSNRSGEVVVNGSSQITGVAFNGTGAWDSWAITNQVDVSLQSGENTITLVAETSGGLANIDYIEVTGDSPGTGSCGAIAQYTLTTNTSGSGNISLDPLASGGTYDDGTSVTVTANPDAGWEFDSWTGDLSGSTNPETILMDVDKSVTANFVETPTTSTITLQENQPGFCLVEGVIESEHSGYTGDGYANVDPNEAGKEVVWSVDAPSSGTYTLQWRFANGGSSDRSCELQVNGTTITTGISFSPTGAWSTWDVTAEVNASLDAGTNTITLIGESSDGQANIDYLDVTGESPSAGDCSGGGTTQYDLTTSTNGSGSISLDPSGGTYDEGTEVAITANADEGWEFNGWSGDLSGSTNPETILMDADKSVTATFVESGSTQYTLTTNVNGSGSISLDPAGGTYDDGTTVSVTANPASGYEFDGWSGDLNGTTNPESIVMDSDKSVTANFVQSSGGGTIDGPGNFVLEALTSANFEAGAHYMLVNRSSGQAMDVENRSIENDASIITAASEDAVHQLWRTEDQGGNYYVVNGYTDKVAREASGNVRQERDGSSSTHTWSIEHVESSYFRLINEDSDNAMAESSSNVVTEVYDGSHNQQWEIFKVTAESETPNFDVEGFATVGFGITGGAGGETVTVDNAADLIFYMQHEDPYIIQVSGTIDMPEGDAHSPSDHMHSIAPDKTIIGIGGDAQIINGGFNIRGTRNDGVGDITHTNVIIRNLSFSNGPDDAINIEQGARNVWVDHNEFSGYADGSVDVKREASHVTVSWNIFHSAGSGKTMLLGHDASHSVDEGHLKVSYHHNYFDGTDSRHPRIRYGEAHLYNNYFENIGSYVVGPGIESSTISENNQVWISNRFTDWYDDSGVVMDRGQGSLLGHIDHDHDLELNSVQPDWAPENYYSYDLHSALNVKDMVSEFSGVGIVDGDGNIDIQYNLSTDIDGDGSITLDPSGGSYDEGTEVTVTASPASGWDFDNWSGDLSGSTNPQTIVMDGNKSVTAHFSSTLPPSKATSPDPADGENGVNLFTSLDWTAGSGAESHDVYFGTSSSLGSGDFQGNQTETSWSTGELNPETTYFWRIDEVNNNGTTTGDVWSFTTGAEASSNFAQVGYSTLDGGTTGGEGGVSVTCSTGDCILQAISDKKDGIIAEPLTIYVNGTVNPSNTSASKIDIKDVSDISVLGEGTSGVFDQVGLKIWRASNIIIRNVTIHHVSDGDGDCIGIEGPSDHIWIDHCEFYNEFQGVDKDFYDGLLDVKRDADYITVSWNYFHDSWKTSLSGSSDSDSDHRRVTYHHNWYENNNSRLPLFRFGEAHIFNNYYNGIESTGINSRMGACVRVENNYFENAHNPIVSCYSSDLGATDETGNIFGSNVTWDLSGSDCSEPNTCSWNQAYSYSSVLNGASEVPDIVTQNSGVGVIQVKSAESLANNDRSQDLSAVMNYPNPFNATTTFKLTLNNRSNVKITLYNSMGQKVAVVADNVYDQGINEVTFDAGHLAAGVYIYHVESDNGTMKKSLIIQ